MEREIKLLTTDAEFALLIPLVVEFTLKLGTTPLWQHLQEICSSFNSDRTIVMLLKVGGELKGYVAGYFVARDQFLVTQAFTKETKESSALYSRFEEEIFQRGGRVLFLHTPHPPRTFEKYGFQFESSLMKKILKEV